ncbi:MAG: hypothetical protein DRJ61_01100 [Acidobacteria bacterium]|nr:MAG: hypothetical protein DRJ65_03795 [Acidobacteriota bacterium]RLE36313.1 MAG: hypothetical protein DRJ61_01100 [Acidobacteriota bacterium]
MSENPDSVAALIQESYELERSGDVGSAVAEARQALDLAVRYDYQRERSAALVCLAYLYNHMGKFEQALELAEEAVGLSASFPRVHVDALMTRGVCLSDIGDLDRTEDSLLKAMELAREEGYREALQKCLHVLSAGVYIPRGSFELAVAADEESLEMVDSLGLEDLRWFPLVTLGWVYWVTGKRQKALKTLDRLEKAVQPYSLGEGYFCCLAADLAQESEDPETAIPLYAKARSIADLIGDPGLGAELRTGLSRYHRRFGSVSTAFTWACDAVSVAERAHSSPTLGWALIEKARCRWVLGDVDDAERDFQRAGDHTRTLGARFDEARIQLLLSALLFDQDNSAAGQMLAETVRTIRSGDFWFLVETERPLVFPLLVHFAAGSDPIAADAAAEMLEQLEKLPPPPLRIVTLGSFEVRMGKRLIPPKNLKRRRSGDLLGLLLISPGAGIEMDRAMEWLWPEKDPRAATANLHQATSALRRALEPDLPEKFPSRYLKVHQGQISLRLPENSWIDFMEFEVLLEKGDFVQALGLYGGDLFGGNALTDDAVIMREHLKQRAVHAALKTAVGEMENGNTEASLDACLIALRLEPWQENAALMGMQALLALGQRAGAIRLYQKLCRCLEEELGVKPQQDLQQYYRSIL